MMDAENWPKPRTTANAQLLLGFLSGLVDQREPYGIVEVDRAKGFVIVRNKATGSRFRVTVEQFGGTE